MIAAIFIGSFLIGVLVLTKMFQSIMRDDAIEHEKLHPKPTDKPKVIARHKNPGKWLTFRGVQIALGLLWLLDGILQLQHQMFSKAFVTQVISPASQGQPHFVSNAMNLGIHLFLLHPAIFNSLAAITQIGIGILILYKPTIKLGLSFSVLWGAVVWIFGEGYGGIFSGHTLLLMGAPGAVLIYMLLALAAWPKKIKAQDNIKKQQVAYWLAFAWLILWVGGGVYQLLPGQNSTAALSSMITTNASSAPAWLASIDNNTAQFVKSFGATYGKQTNQQITGMSMGGMHTTSSGQTMPTKPGFQFILFLAFMQISIGIGVLVKGLTRNVSIGLGILLALIFWVVGQGLGNYYTGTATDPNSGPLLVLLGLAILGCNNLDLKLLRFRSSFRRILIGKSRSITQPDVQTTN